MAFTFTAKKWEKVQPTKEKGSAVAKAITALTAATRKKVGAMKMDEVDAAYKATFALIDAFDDATTKIGSASDPKSTAAKKAIVTWRKECATFADELRQRRHALYVELFTSTHNLRYTQSRDRVNAVHKEAGTAYQTFMRSGTIPDHRDVMRWMTHADRVLPLCTKDELLKMSVDGIPAGALTAKDLRLPADVTATKAKVKQINAWCEDFAKAAKAAAKGAGRELDDSLAVDKEVKEILAEYVKIEKAMKPVIGQAKRLATISKQKADLAKKLVSEGDTDAKKLTDLVQSLGTIQSDLNRLNSDVKNLNDPWREKGALALRVQRCEALAGFDPQRHGKLLHQREDVSFKAIRLATVPLGDVNQDYKRAKRLLSDSTNHRGYAAHL